MANDNRQIGLIPLKPPGMKDIPANYYAVSTASDIFLGQPIQLAAAGYVVGIGTPTGVTQTIGVAIGFAGTNVSGLASNQPYLKVSDLTPPTPSSDTGDRFVLVADSPDQEYLIQEDTGGTALTRASVGEAFDLLYGGGAGPTNVTSGSVVTGWAALELDRSTTVTTTGAFVQLLRLHNNINSDGTLNAVGNYGKWVVKFLHHSRKGANVVPTV